MIERVVKSAWKGHELGLPPQLVKVLQWALTFNVVCLAWVFFRAQSVDGAFEILGRLFSGFGNASGDVSLLLIVVVVGMVASQFVPKRIPAVAEVYFARLAPLLQIAALGVGLMLIDALGPEGIAPFIYFQF